MARTVVKWGLLAYVAVTFGVIAWQEVRADGAVLDVAFEDGDYLLVTYVHADKRCLTCNNMEAFTKDALERHFTSRLAAGTLRLHSFNWQAPERAAWTAHYDLLGNGVLVSEVRGGTEVRFKYLDDVWSHAHDREEFVAYVRDELQGWLTTESGGP